MTTLHLGIEDMEPGNWVAWVFELPGCYARGTMRDEAIDSVPPVVADLTARLAAAGFAVTHISSPFTYEVAEEFRAYPSRPDYLVNAFFENDKTVLEQRDVEYAIQLFHLNRRDLLSIINGLSPDQLDRDIPGEAQKNLRGILRHIGTAEWWYWDRLDMAFPRGERPDDIFQLLPNIRGYTLQRLSDLIHRPLCTERSGEKWSPRKLVRRAIWHERVHTLQIARYLKQFSA
jgi:hypothetical protein